MPVTELAMSSPSRSRSWVSRTACSSGVRVGHGREPPVMGQATGRVGIRLGADAHPDALLGLGHAVGLVAGVQPDDRLGVPHVDDQQHDQSPSPSVHRTPDEIEAQVEHGGRMGQRARPISGPVRPRRSRRSSPASRRPRPRSRSARSPRRAPRAMARGHRRRDPCCRAARRRPRPAPPRPPAPASSHSICTRRPGHSARARATASVMVTPARWLSLTSTASERLERWLTPPPAWTAAFSSARSPGVVLRVSSTCTAGLRAWAAATYRAVKRGDAREPAQEVERGALRR